MIEEIGDQIKVHIAIDPKEPDMIYDRLNELEVSLIKRAGNDLEKIKHASDFVDDLRKKTKQMLRQAGIEIQYRLRSSDG